jgi:hypothetical protein
VHKKQAPPQASVEITRAAANFESGFTGFSGLTATSPVWVGRLLLHAALSPFFSPMRYASAKSGI